MSRATVLLADNHQLFVEGIQKLLEPEFQIVRCVADGRELVEKALAYRPKAILIGISLPRLNGIEAVRRLCQAGCPSKCVMLTMHADLELVSAALEAGASGYVLKHCDVEEVRTALREVLIGRQYITPRLAQAMLKAHKGPLNTLSPMTKLTRREREVLQLVAEGMSVKETAAELNVSPRTVEFHRYNASDKLGLKSVAELARYAVKHGLVAP